MLSCVCETPRSFKGGALPLSMLTSLAHGDLQTVLDSAAICEAIYGFATGADIVFIIVQNIRTPFAAVCYGANLASHTAVQSQRLWPGQSVQSSPMHFAALTGVSRLVLML
uniref:AA_permease domain-containing protein n=1 Tax=Steinernema glaseri TaxID=37863 RepID=A0A1I7Z5U8_9BILA